jgi:hypothetical protein
LYYEAYLHEGEKKFVKRRGNLLKSLISLWYRVWKRFFSRVSE